METLSKRSQYIFGNFGLSIRNQEPLFRQVFPKISLSQTILISLLGTVLISILTQVKFYLPDNPVPVTLQTFGVLTIGGFLGWRWGLVSILTYYLIGALGLPIFANGGGGFDYVFQGVTGGYLLGFILATFLVGYLYQRGWNNGKILWGMLVGSIFIYVPALIWLSIFDFSWPPEGQLLEKALYPFIPGDLIKLILASLVITGINNFVNKKDV